MAKLVSVKPFAWFLTAGAALGLVASFIITLEKYRLLLDPHYVPSCSLNPVISCGSVMSTPQAAAFGFPNSWIGLIGFTAVLVTGIGLLSGANFSAWYWRTLNAGMALGVIFIHWLFGQSVYVIHALCPWCMVVWAVTIVLFVYTTVFNIQSGRIPVPRTLKPTVSALVPYRHVIVVLWYATIAALILHHFWYFFKTVF